MKQPCSLLRRVGAMLYDALLILAILFLTTIPFVAMRGGEPVEAGNLPYLFTLVVVIYLFFVGFWTRSGRTPACSLGACGSKMPTAASRRSAPHRFALSCQSCRGCR